MLYPQFVPREGEGGGEGGGGFWQGVFNYFGSCGGEGSGTYSRIIPPTTQTTVTDGNAEKQGTMQKEDGLIDRKPSKPFYYVLPPSPGFNHYFPQPDLFNQPFVTTSFRISNAKSINDRMISKNDEINTKNPSDIEISNGHANEKNVN